MAAPVGRFAPSPSGRMHLGNIFSSLIAWLSAKSRGGKIILRIEDIDRDRCRREYAEQLMRDLENLGLYWDEGGDKGGAHAPYFQQERGSYYEKLLDKLSDAGLIYPCFCSRAELHAASAPHASDGELIYSGRCRELSAQEVEKLSRERKAALRLKVRDEIISFTDGSYGEQRQNLRKDCGDFILRRSDGIFAYQLAVVADDAAMGVTEVVRGRDLLSSTPRQLYLYRLLGFEPPEYFHVPMLLSPDGRRLSKRDGDISLEALSEKGLSPQDIIGRLAFLAGIIDSPEPATPEQLIPHFSWDKVRKDDLYVPEGLF